MIVPTVTPAAPVKIRFKVNPTPSSHGAGMGVAAASASASGSGKGKRVASNTFTNKAKHARIGMSPPHSEHKAEEGELRRLMIESPTLDSKIEDDGEEFYSDDLDENETRSTSPSKLTARQRAKGNKDLQETLVSLPGTFLFISLVCTLGREVYTPGRWEGRVDGGLEL
jgi:hypothetical protein